MNESGPVNPVDVKYSYRERQRLYLARIAKMSKSAVQRLLDEQTMVEWYEKRAAIASDPGLFRDRPIAVAKRHGVFPQEIYTIRAAVRREPR